MIVDIIVASLMPETHMRRWCALGLLGLALAAPASAFDFSRYGPGDLDAMVRHPRPESGADVFRPRNHRIVVSLVRHAWDCDAQFMKMAMKTVGFPADQVDSVPISKCILVRSAGGNIVPMYIQNTVAEFLSREVAKDTAFTVFVMFLYVGRDGPGLLVNEFSTDTALPEPSPT